MSKAQVYVRVLGCVPLGGDYLSLWIQGVCAGYGAAGLFGTVAFGENSEKERYRGSKGSRHIRAKFFFARYSMVANLVSTIGQFTDIFMLNYLVKDRNRLGYYSLATVGIAVLSQITATIQVIANHTFPRRGMTGGSF